jgi:hypothetical protein
VAHPLLAAFGEHHALQYGLCTPGMIMSSLECCSVSPSQQDATFLAGGHALLPDSGRPQSHRRHPHPAILSDAENRRRT